MNTQRKTIKNVYLTSFFIRMVCFYEAFNAYSKLDISNNYDDHITKCEDYCKIIKSNQQKPKEVSLSVWFRNSSTTISSKSSGGTYEINCTFFRETDGIQSTLLPTQTETSASTLWVDNTTRTSETSKGSSDINTTSEIEFTSVLTQTNTFVSTVWADDTSNTSQTKEGAVNVVTEETDTTTFMETSTSNPQNCTCIPQLESKTSCNHASSSGAFVGAVLGGGVLGAVITIIVFVFFHEKLSKLFKKMTLGGVKNPVYEPEVIQLDDRQISPVTGTEVRSDNYNEIIEPTHIEKPSLQQHENSSKKDDVYNHLHENHLHQSEKGDRSDNYDHAVLATADGNGYGMVSVDRGINDNYCEVDPKNISCSETLRSKESNPYFTLEAQDD